MAASLILASASPRRLALLAQAGIHPDRVLAPDIDETPRKAELPRLYARRIARAKLDAVPDATPGDGFVLAADTVVALGRRILPKPEDEPGVRTCLELLSGRRHHVITCVVLRAPDGSVAERTVDTAVVFGRLPPDQVESYLRCGEGIGKAGGYAIQGRAALFVRQLIGSYTGVVGLPLFETANLLRGRGYPVEPPPA